MRDVQPAVGQRRESGPVPEVRALAYKFLRKLIFGKLKIGIRDSWHVTRETRDELKKGQVVDMR